MDSSNDSAGAHYLVSVRPLREDLVSFAVYSQFVGFSPRHPQWEMRAASEIKYDWLCRIIRSTGRHPRAPVQDPWSLAKLMVGDGGWAAVSATILHQYLPNLAEPVECVRDVASFVPTFNPTDDQVSRTAPTRRQRANVLRRDRRRCAICGRSPLHHTDVELDVHHVLPVRKHGPTVEENLLTLCGTCHAGLDPDHDPTLRNHGRLAGPLAGSLPRSGNTALVIDNLVDGIIVNRRSVI